MIKRDFLCWYIFIDTYIRERYFCVFNKERKQEVDENIEETINITLTHMELKNIIYGLYELIKEEDIYTHKYINILKNIFDKLTVPMEELYKKEYKKLYAHNNLNGNDLINKLLIKVKDLKLSKRSYNCLINEHIFYVGDLIQKTPGHLLMIDHFGQKSLNEIKEVLDEMGLSLGMMERLNWKLLQGN